MISTQIALEASLLRSDARVKLDQEDIRIETRKATFGGKVLVSDLKLSQNTNAVSDLLWPLVHFLDIEGIALQVRVPTYAYCLGEWNFSCTLHVTSKVDWNAITAYLSI
jgi:hypothetical protein